MQQKWSTIFLKIVVSVLLINYLIHQVASEKKKKVIIKVPAHVKHIYHHHLKTVHIHQPKPKEHHIHHNHVHKEHQHHDHHEIIHNDRDDYKSNRNTKGYGSWRDYDSEKSTKTYRDYRAYTSLSKERPPPPEPPIYYDDDYVAGGYRGWKPMGEGKGYNPYRWRDDSTYGRGPGIKNKGVVYEPEGLGLEKSKRYEEIDLTYGAAEKYRNYYSGITDNRGFKNHDDLIRNYDSPEDVEYSTSIIRDEYAVPPKEFNNHDSSYNIDKKVQSDVIYNQDSTNVWNEQLNSPINVWTEKTKVVTPPVLPPIKESIWPALQESSWNLNKNSDTVLYNYNNNNNNNNKTNNKSNAIATAASFVYHNHGLSTPVETIAKPVTPVTPFQSTFVNKKPVSSYQVQVMHFNNEQPQTRV
ncbi:uncharacterized protein LOC142329236 [Lycorma delicatula]|uniref:uncharacterized protein LOC142329236 n=1 Tax=Lycorma delicatula TaxID=130591 RepID=UPI003F514EDC